MSVRVQVHPKLAARNLTFKRLRFLPFSTTDTDVIVFNDDEAKNSLELVKRKSYRNVGKILHLVEKNLDSGDMGDERPLQNTAWLKRTYCVF